MKTTITTLALFVFGVLNCHGQKDTKWLSYASLNCNPFLLEGSAGYHLQHKDNFEIFGEAGYRFKGQVLRPWGGMGGDYRFQPYQGFFIKSAVMTKYDYIFRNVKLSLGLMYEYREFSIDKYIYAAGVNGYNSIDRYLLDEFDKSNKLTCNLFFEASPRKHWSINWFIGCGITVDKRYEKIYSWGYGGDWDDKIYDPPQRRTVTEGFLCLDAGIQIRFGHIFLRSF